MEFDRLDGHESLIRVELLEQFLYVFDAKQPVNTLEHLRLIGREEGCKEALGGAPPPLELARCASLAAATSQGHRSSESKHDSRNGYGVLFSQREIEEREKEEEEEGAMAE